MSTQPVAFEAPLAPINPKSKAVAVVLACLLTFWTWAYTYKVDGWKFWLNLVLSVFTLGIWGIFVSWPWAIIQAAIRPREWYENYPNGDALKQRQATQRAVYAQQQAQAVPPAPAGTVEIAQESEVAVAEPVVADAAEATRSTGATNEDS